MTDKILSRRGIIGHTIQKLPQVGRHGLHILWHPVPACHFVQQQRAEVVDDNPSSLQSKRKSFSAFPMLFVLEATCFGSRFLWCLCVVCVQSGGRTFLLVGAAKCQLWSLLQQNTTKRNGHSFSFSIAFFVTILFAGPFFKDNSAASTPSEGALARVSAAEACADCTPFFLGFFPRPNLVNLCLVRLLASLLQPLHFGPILRERPF